MNSSLFNHLSSILQGYSKLNNRSIFGRNNDKFIEYLKKSTNDGLNGEENMINKVDHIGIAVKSLEKALPFYTEILGLELQGIEEVESEKVKVAFINAGNTKIELLEPTSDKSPIAMHIEKRGEGIHHIALGVNSIEERIEEIKAKGIEMINAQAKIGAGGAHVAFMHPKSTGKVLLEFCEKKGKGE